MISALAESEADAREALRQAIDLLADVSAEKTVAELCYQREYLLRLHGDAAIVRLQRQNRALREENAMLRRRVA